MRSAETTIILHTIIFVCFVFFAVLVRRRGPTKSSDPKRTRGKLKHPAGWLKGTKETDTFFIFIQANV
jgi:hypothetical protein